MNRANHFSSIKYSMNPIENARIRNMDRKHQVVIEKSITSVPRKQRYFSNITIIVMFFFNRESSVSKQG